MGRCGLRTARVQQLGQDGVDLLANGEASSLEAIADEVTEEILATEKEIALRQTIEQGKPEHIAEKMVEGRMRKYFEENTLLKQGFVKDPDTSIEDLVASHGSDVGVRRFVRFAIGG